jgi:hypothetical protein
VDAKRTIEDWLTMFKQLYSEPDARRRPPDVWIAATAHFAAMGEAIRRMHFADLMRSAAHAFCWMCSYVLVCQREEGTVFHVAESFSDIIASKYPLVCGHCGQRSCLCKAKSMDEAEDKTPGCRSLLKWRKELAEAPKTYSTAFWREKFGDIYAQQIHMLTLESVGFHFLEESGEEMTAIRSLMQLSEAPARGVEGIDDDLVKKLSTFEGIVDEHDRLLIDKERIDLAKNDPAMIRARLVYAKLDMFIEFADTFSWFCGILNKVSSIASNCGVSECSFSGDAFERRLEAEYLQDGKPLCPRCKQSPCACVFWFQGGSPC